jgi:hypothetical protein
MLPDTEVSETESISSVLISHFSLEFGFIYLLSDFLAT